MGVAANVEVWVIVWEGLLVNNISRPVSPSQPLAQEIDKSSYISEQAK